MNKTLSDKSDLELNFQVLKIRIRIQLMDRLIRGEGVQTDKWDEPGPEWARV